MKKTIVVMLIAVLAASVLFAGCTAVSKNNTDGNVIYSDDFESYKPGEMPDGWEIMYNGSGDTNQGVFEIDGDMCLVADGTEGNSAVLIHKFVFPEDALVKVEYTVHSVDQPGGMLFSNGVLGCGSGVSDGWHDYVMYINFIDNTRQFYEDGVLIAESDLSDATIGWLGSSTGRESCISMDSSNLSTDSDLFMKNITVTVVDGFPQE